jgi:hypothetical protein
MKREQLAPGTLCILQREKRPPRLESRFSLGDQLSLVGRSLIM